ncbi:MAG TPA: acyltransferase domain-containing protein [Verrucomicrobiae bacterium]|nr:acyltransferase domain-containing protein [Verrucomicrobiae bacterium]
MICFMYPGQPLGREGAPEPSADFEAIVSLTLDRTGLDISAWSWNSAIPSENVALQVYGGAVSLYRTRVLAAEGRRPALAAEHSMGIYAALAACGALDEGDCLELIARIGRALAEMGTRASYALGCVTGLPAAPLLAIAEEHGVFLANRNTSRHFLIAGTKAAVEEATAASLTAGAFTARTFPADAPLHTPLVEEIAPLLGEVVADYRFLEPQIPLMEHLGQDFLCAADIPGFLVRELCAPVNWEETYLALRKRGVHQFVETGCGESLRKYNRWISSERGV